MTTLRVILGDQLSHDLPTLHDISEGDIILIMEVRDETQYVKHHKKKIALIFSAMRHFAKELENKKYKVDYVKLTDPDNQHSFTAEVKRAIERHKDVKKIAITEANEYRVQQEIAKWGDKFAMQVDILDDNRFLCSHNNFEKFAKDRKSLRMEYFYREMRKQYNILMTKDHKPEGGEWNYDSDNREVPNDNHDFPNPLNFEHDEITKEVLALVENEFPDHFGDLYPFHFATTRDEALKVLDYFIQTNLKNFGRFQDAMIQNQPWMHHSHVSFYINIGLLSPLECIKAAEKAYHTGETSLSSVEGFIRQILGWREFIRGIYWLNMPDYAAQNFLEASHKLPEFFWNGQTKMNCLRQAILETKENAYAHHIQRLMVIGNFCLIAGIDPKYVNEWFLIVYADAFEWVEMPNVTGMALFADGGVFASKPYASSGTYINKMSNYCSKCSYKVTKKNGSDACPFNYLYWDFLARNREKLSNNPRIAMMYKTYDRMGDDKKQAITNDSERFLKAL